MKVLLVYNLHRFGGGSDVAALATERELKNEGLSVETFAYDSQDLPAGLRGKVQAFTYGIYARQAVHAFRKNLKKHLPDVVHVQELYPLISPWILPVCSEFGIPVVMTCHDYRLTCPIATHYKNGKICTRCVNGQTRWCAIGNCRSNLFESIAFSIRAAVANRYQLFLTHINRFITATDFAGDWLANYTGVDRRQFVTIPYIIETPPKSANPADGSYIGYAGRFVPEKGITPLLKAVDATGYPLHVAGDTATMPELRNHPKIVFKGQLGPDKMKTFYQNARMLVVPSIWFETFGIVAGEAMSHGVPVIASRIGALQEVVDHEINGLLFEPGNVRELATHIDRLWKNPDESVRFGQAGRKKIESLCARNVHVKRLLETYEDVIREKVGQT